MIMVHTIHQRLVEQIRQRLQRQKLERDKTQSDLSLKKFEAR